MIEDLSVIDNEEYNLGLQEIEEAANIQKQIKELESQRNEKIEEAKIHLMVGVKEKTKELQSKLEICDRQMLPYHRIIGKIKQELQDNYHTLEEEEKLRNKLLENQQYLNLWLDKREEIKSLLGKLCQRFGHQIDISEEPVKREYINKKDAEGFIISFEVLRYYVCKRCGKEVLFDDDFGLKDWEWYNVLNTKFTKRIVDEEVSFDNTKLVLGKPKVILPHVDK